MNARQLATQLTAWAEATVSGIEQLRYLARRESSADEQTRLLGEAMALELLCEEIQIYARRFSTLRQLRGAVEHLLAGVQRELARAPAMPTEADSPGQSAAWKEGRAQGYRRAWQALSEIMAQRERHASEYID